MDQIVKFDSKSYNMHAMNELKENKLQYKTYESISQK